MKRLNELQSLVKLAQNFGQDPDPKVLAEIKYLQEQQDKKLKQQTELRARVHAASQALFEAPVTEYKRPSAYPDGKSIPANLPDLYQPASNAGVPENQRCDNCEYYVAESKKCTRWNNAVVRPAYWCAKWEKLEHKSEPVKEQTLVDQVAKNISESTVVGPEPALVPKPTDPLARKVDLLEKWISRIAATGPGGGAGDVVNLDYPVKTITVSSYTVLRRDHYLGINVGTSTTIILPLTGVKQGRNIIVKDESGHCSINPITITGTIDNDTSGATLAIDNGGLHFIYNNGWRIV